MQNIPDKHKVKQEVLQQLKEQQRLLEQVVQTAADASTHAEAKSEGKYDTRAIESSYLAGAQSERLQELKGKIQSIERLSLESSKNSMTVKTTSLVLVSDENGTSFWYMLLPGAAAMKTASEGAVVTIVSPESRLGTDLLGKAEGDDIEAVSGKHVRPLVIEKIC